jgi:hypothetical protein
MEEATVAIINRLDVGYIEIMIPCLIIFAAWVFSHLRRDKQGKLYWFKRSYEDTKTIKYLSAINDKADDMGKRMTNIEIDQCKLAFYSDIPIKERLFAGLRYIQSGGNSETKHYVEEMIKDNLDLYNGLVLGRPDLKLEGL